MTCPRMIAFVAVALGLSTVGCAGGESGDSEPTPTPMPELMAATDGEVGELRNLVVAHAGAVDSAPDMPTVFGIESRYFGDALRHQIAMHRTWEDMALCMHDGVRADIADEGRVLDALQEELQNHRNAMIGAVGLVSMHHEEARHQGVMVELMDTLSSEQDKLEGYGREFMCSHTDDDMHHDTMHGR